MTKAATKVIELRREKDDYSGTGERYRRVSAELYFSRHTFDHDHHPMIIDFYQRADGKGLNMFIPTFSTSTAEDALNKKQLDGRAVWAGQIDDSLNDLKEAMNG